MGTPSPLLVGPMLAAGGGRCPAPAAGVGGPGGRRPHRAAAVPRSRTAPLRLAAALLLGGVDAAAAGEVKKASFGVQARIVSGWPQTPSPAQSVEWLRDVDPEEAGAFVLGLGASGAAASLEAEGGLVGQALCRSASARTFHELLVRNSYYSPRIETLRTFERRDRGLYGGSCSPGSAWALLWPAGAAAPSVACEAASLRKELETATRGASGLPGNFFASELDLVLRRSSAQAVVVLYGTVSAEGLPSLGPLLREVDAMGASSSWRVVFRHADGPVGATGPGADVLTGYGFELAIKSSEYKTHADESKTEGEKAEGAEGGGDGDAAEGDVEQPTDEEQLDGPVEMDGLLFHVLLKRYAGAGLRPRLRAFKEQLEVERDTDAVLKAWEIKDIGLQAVHRIKSSTTPLLAMMRLSQNFPAHVVGLARTSVPDGLRRSIQLMHQTIRENAEVFSINGRLVRPDHSELSLFPMMKTLQPFFVGVERLVRIGLSEDMACKLLQETHGVQRLPSRLDWRSPLLPPPSYLVTKDKKSARWGSQLQHMLYAMPGGLAPVRLALYHVVFVFDPAEVSDLMQAQQLLAQTPLPMSLHFVMLPGARAQAAADWDEQALGERPDWLPQRSVTATAPAQSSRASRVIAVSYAMLLQKSPKRARLYLKALAEWAESSAAVGDKAHERLPDTDAAMTRMRELWVDATQPLEEKAWAETTWDTAVAGGGSEPGGPIANATEYVAALGMPIPSMLVNGKLILKAAYDTQQSIYPTIGSEQQQFQQAVYMGRLVAEDQILKFIASQGLLAAFHEDITPEVAQRGGEESQGGGRTAEVAYLQWPTKPFLALPFLDSVEPEEEVSDDRNSGGRLGFFHVTVLRRLSHTYMLQTFASHLLKPDRSALGDNKQLKVPLLASHWAALVDVTAGDATEEERSALAELRACVSGALGLKVAEPDAADDLNRQRLRLLKFLGAALPAALAAAPLAPGEVVEKLCDLGIQNKIDPEHHVAMRALVVAARTPEAAIPGEAIVATAKDAAGNEGKSAAAFWICNGRRMSLEVGGQPVSPKHVQALEIMEAQFDLGQAGGEDGDDDDQVELDEMGMPAPKMPKEKSAESAKALHQWLQEAVETEKSSAIPVTAHGLIAAIRSEALSHGKNERFTQPSEIFERVPESFRLHLPPARPDAASPIRVYGILDPLSDTAQSASAVLALFGMTFNAEVNLVLNPIARHSEYPLKRYYREVIRWPERLADGRAVAELEGGEVGSAQADFPSLATRHVLTAAVHALPTWLVTAYEAEHDMDNLRIADVGDGRICETTYQLRQLYVEGQAFVLGEDGWPIAPAKGLQIDVVGKGSKEAPDDTIVMGNLGYFQVHGNPGLYEVSPKAGLSNETFELASDSVPELEVSSYITPPFQLRVRLRPGRSLEDMMEVDKMGGSRSARASGGKRGWGSRLFGSLKSMLGGEEGAQSDSQAVAAPAEEGGAVATSGSDLPTIHIFSVASGHLYEKLLGIMILSVRNGTKCPLHFHFIDNFLSPKFKAFIPQMARRYNFGYSFVTYKWPSWLNPQSEKQRLIWAYKVLFLDVLFPLDVPKVLFIDADQVVRADVRELWDMDLQGKVYGFVPMGDTNPDTEGFRFWKQGYWSNHLQGLPYHISALYVVDLVEFRRTSIGDSLRGVYNQLSRDPNSLSNLEQDLINFAQHQVPIFSLPSNWLWCETWCSQETKPQAKTIDLCQNPLTKEPKIVMARRIISEWQMYHDEVSRFQEGLESTATANTVPKLSTGKAEL